VTRPNLNVNIERSRSFRGARQFHLVQDFKTTPRYGKTDIWVIMIQ